MRFVSYDGYAMAALFPSTLVAGKDAIMESISCILCGTDQASLYKEENGYRAMQCDHCGLVYVSPRPSLEEMKELYDGQETHIDIDAHIRQRDLKCAQAKRSLSLISRYRTHGRILEVGSAAGYFLWEARKLGFEVQGVDLTHRLCEFATEVLHVPTFEGTLRQASFEPERFDVVYMRNVLSHLAYPVEEFQSMWRLLRPGGYLVFETGNVAELSPQEAGELELPDHLFHHSENTIRKLLKKTRFDWIETHRFVLLSRLATIRKALERVASLADGVMRGTKWASSGRVARFVRRSFGQKTRATPSSQPGQPGQRSVDGHESNLDMPAANVTSRLVAEAAQVVRYDLGRLLPAAGQRSTLVVVARRPETV